MYPHNNVAFQRCYGRLCVPVSSEGTEAATVSHLTQGLNLWEVKLPLTKGDKGSVRYKEI